MLDRPKTSIKSRLSILMFLQFFIWGSWYVTAGTYLLEKLSFTGIEVGMVYGSTAIAAILSPVLFGRIADQWMAMEKILFLLHGIGSIIMLALSFTHHFLYFYPLVVVYSLLYMPTFTLTSAMTFHHVLDTTKDFSRIRVWGTIGWIVAGLLIGWLQLESSRIPLQIYALTSIFQSLYCLTLPTTPPSRRGSSKTLFSGEVLILLRQRSFLVLTIALSLLCIPSAFYYSFTNPFLTEVGIKSAASLMSIGQVSEIIFMLTLSFFLRRVGLKNLLILGMCSWGLR